MLARPWKNIFSFPCEVGIIPSATLAFLNLVIFFCSKCCYFIQNRCHDTIFMHRFSLVIKTSIKLSPFNVRKTIIKKNSTDKKWCTFMRNDTLRKLCILTVHACCTSHLSELMTTLVITFFVGIQRKEMMIDCEKSRHHPFNPDCGVGCKKKLFQEIRHLPLGF